MLSSCLEQEEREPLFFPPPCPFLAFSTRGEKKNSLLVDLGEASREGSWPSQGLKIEARREKGGGGG